MTKRLNMLLLFNAIQKQERLLEKGWRGDTGGMADLSPYFLAIDALAQRGIDACSRLSPPRQREKMPSLSLVKS